MGLLKLFVAYFFIVYVGAKFQVTTDLMFTGFCILLAGFIANSSKE